MDKIQFSEWCQENEGSTNEEDGIVECKFNRDEKISWSPEGLDIIDEDGQMISKGASLPDGVDGNRILAESAQTGPNSPVDDYQLEVRGSYPNGDIRRL